MEISLGGCHYGIDDTATMTGVRPGRSGWIAVCDRHRDQAEAAGFVLRAVAVPAPPPTAPVVAPTPAEPLDDAAGDLAVASAVGGLDLLDEMLDERLEA